MHKILHASLPWTGNQEFDTTFRESVVDLLFRYPGEDIVLLYSRYPDHKDPASIPYHAKIDQPLLEELTELLGKEAVKLEERYT